MIIEYIIKKYYSMVNEWSEEKKLKFKKNYILGKLPNENVENMNIDEINLLFHKLKSESVKKSQKKRKETINKKGANEWSRMVQKGIRTRKINFLINNNIVDNIEKLSENEIDILFNKYFNKITNHGKKIKDGRKSKYGDNYKKSFQEGHKKAFINYCNKMQWDLTPENYDELYKKFCDRLTHDVKKWKKSHLKNRNIVFNENNFEQKYAEYVRDRFTKLPDSKKIGYKRTKKGWFKLYDNSAFFYRSSWELKVLKELNELYRENKIEYIKVPERIMYYINNYRHYYFPDIEYKVHNCDRKILEIKPNKKLDENINKNKVSIARKKHGKNFLVLTEYEIFVENLKNNLLEYGRL